MAWYMLQFRLTPEMWSKRISEPEEHRGDVLRRVVQRFGGQVKDIWYTSGEYDGLVICELQDHVTAAAISIAYSATGMLKDIHTTMLLGPDEVRQALHKAGGQDAR